MAIVEDRRRLTAQAAAEDWLAAFETALQAGDAGAVAGLFRADGLWRDVLAFTWTIGTMAGRPAIEAMLRETLARTKPKNFHIPAKRTPPRWVTRAGTDCIEALFDFDTAVGPCNGVLRLKPDWAGRLYAWTFNTNLHEIRGHEEAFKRRGEPGSTRDFGAENWSDRLARQRAFADRDPAVLVVGGGQAGLCIAARLQQLGIAPDRRPPRPRRRQLAQALSLADAAQRGLRQSSALHAVPADLAGLHPEGHAGELVRAYVDALELNDWTGTSTGERQLRRAAQAMDRDAAPGRRQRRVMHPRHLIFATGVSSIPFTPDLPGLTDFAGVKVHSGGFADAEHWRGRKALVLGSGTSGHDVAQELQAHGADVTMIQRSKTYVVSLKEAQSVYAIYSEGIPFDDCDLLATTFPYPVLHAPTKCRPRAAARSTRHLLGALEKRGFRLWAGEDETGFQMMYRAAAGGDYFNVGCSELLSPARSNCCNFPTLKNSSSEACGLRTARSCRPTSWCWRPATRTSRRRCGFISATPSPTRLARSGASTTAASCATCGSARRSRVSGSPPVHSRNAASSRVISRCRSKHWKRGC